MWYVGFSGSVVWGCIYKRRLRCMHVGGGWVLMECRRERERVVSMKEECRLEGREGVSAGWERGGVSRSDGG